MTVYLAAVAGGDSYRCYAEGLMETAREFFKPGPKVEYLILDGVEGWPNGTLFRYHCLLEQVPFQPADYVFLCDADMRFEAPVGPEIIPDSGLVATLHPGYVWMPREMLPYESSPRSTAYVRPDTGGVYYAGGFVGGRGDAVTSLSYRINLGINKDLGRGIVARWHDESHLNRYLSQIRPALELPPSYCHPENDSYYRSVLWQEDYPRILVALDKTQEERGVRD